MCVHVVCVCVLGSEAESGRTFDEAVTQKSGVRMVEKTGERRDGGTLERLASG